MTTYNNHLSKHKEHCRNIIYNLVRTYKTVGNKKIKVLTLPSTNFILEEKLLGLGNVELSCVERDENVIKQQLKSPIVGKVNLYKGDVTDLLLQRNDYQVIWLDYCGSLTSGIITKLCSYIQNLELESPIYLAITISGRREYKGQDISKVYKQSLESFRIEGFPNLLNEFAESNNKHCKLLHTYSYKGEFNNYSTPMIMHTFKITNK